MAADRESYTQKMNETVYILCPFDPDEEHEKGYIIEEAQGLCRALSLKIGGVHPLVLKKISPATYVTKGHLDDIALAMEECGADLLYIDTQIKPGQQRELEKRLKVKVIDRQGLILEIFADRAQTEEGKIQVNLALKKYQKSRLVRAWTHLERQRGGGGFIGGPGEKQTELDKRLLDNDIRKLDADLKKIAKNRNLQRKARERESFPIIALVGYTNAGKSTLFNALTKASVLSKDMLFATLDPKMQALRLPNGQKAILSDTVGFVRNLPTELVAAFRATLEEVAQADIILHVQDISSDNRGIESETVLDTLDSLGIEPSADHILNVYNKLDLLDKIDPFEANRQMNLATNDSHSAAISAFTGQGIEGLLETITHHLGRDEIECYFEIPSSNGKAMSWLHSNANVLDVSYQEDIAIMHIKIGQAARQKFEKVFGFQADIGHG